MATNFDYLLSKSEYSDFATQAIEAENSLAISPANCAILSRRALELAVRFVYSYDAELTLPYQDNISSLIHESTFRNIIEPRLFPMLKYTIHELKNYKKKVEFYLQEHKDKMSVYKLRNNKKLTEADLKELERILWSELGSKNDYEKEYGDTPVGRLVRNIVGVDGRTIPFGWKYYYTIQRRYDNSKKNYGSSS